MSPLLAVHILVVFSVFIVTVFLIFVEVEQLVLPLFTRFAAVLVGVYRVVQESGRGLAVQAKGWRPRESEHVPTREKKEAAS